MPNWTQEREAEAKALVVWGRAHSFEIRTVIFLDDALAEIERLREELREGDGLSEALYG